MCFFPENAREGYFFPILLWLRTLETEASQQLMHFQTILQRWNKIREFEQSQGPFNWDSGCVAPFLNLSSHDFAVFDRTGFGAAASAGPECPFGNGGYFIPTGLSRATFLSYSLNGPFSNSCSLQFSYTHSCAWRLMQATKPSHPYCRPNGTRIIPDLTDASLIRHSYAILSSFWTDKQLYCGLFKLT